MNNATAFLQKQQTISWQGRAITDLAMDDNNMDMNEHLSDHVTQLNVRMAMMKKHRVFTLVKRIEDLRVFMQWHVFAVWDFMSLAKRLQRDLTYTELPWMPPANNKAARLINEIVLGEETDDVPGGGHKSHFELYLDAMREIGAATWQIEYFLDRLRIGITLDDALRDAQVNPAVTSFVQSTLNTASQKSTVEVLGNFFYSREDAIPSMFQHLLDNWTVDPAHAQMFVYYLVRHIHLDAESHGRLAEAIIQELVHGEEELQIRLYDAALAAVNQRLHFWDELSLAIEQLPSRLN